MINVKAEFKLVIAFSLALSLVSGCVAPRVSNNPPQPPANNQSNLTAPQTPPQQSLVINLDFPNGSPGINQSARLTCTIINRERIDANFTSLKVVLPDAFQLVQGNLSWSGIIPPNSQTQVIDVVIKAVKTGNLTIGYIQDFSMGSLSGHGLVPAIFVMITENSSTWGTRPIWAVPGQGTKPIQSKTPASPP